MDINYHWGGYFCNNQRITITPKINSWIIVKPLQPSQSNIIIFAMDQPNDHYFPLV